MCSKPICLSSEWTQGKATFSFHSVTFNIKCSNIKEIKNAHMQTKTRLFTADSCLIREVNEKISS
jgi:hypothetical protein